MRKSRKAVAWSCFGLLLYLTAEAFLPAAWQPSARVSVALIHAYQATGSHLMESSGVRCRYTPTCSHYAEDAISYYGFLNGGVRAAGRLLRCSPWGSAGYDPAVDTHPAAYLAPTQESEEDRKKREKAEKEAQEAIDKFFKDGGKEAGAGLAACGLGCATVVIVSLISIGVMVFFMVFAYKDAKARGDQNAVLWLVLIFFLHTVGFIVYLVARPKGELNLCPHCHQKKLETLVKCPHCGIDLGPAAAPPAAPPPKA